MPKARIEEVDCQLDETYIIDATERPIQRESYQQETFYSGKKKMHTLKNALLVSSLGLLVWLGQTHGGRIHDKTMVNSLTFNTPIEIVADLGFLAWKPSKVNLILPYKKPRNTKTRNKQLTGDQKAFNNALSKKRGQSRKCLSARKNFTHCQG